ncbi:hypothetical protein M0804_013877 [Polistes exclamans]|nr:hypothetical protein M0804_013877 [Polistes exclamans]
MCLFCFNPSSSLYGLCPLPSPFYTPPGMSRLSIGGTAVQSHVMIAPPPVGAPKIRQEVLTSDVPIAILQSAHQQG